jgi:hypothetical protein
MVDEGTWIESRLLDQPTNGLALCFPGYSAEVPVAEGGQSPRPLQDSATEAQGLYTHLQIVRTQLQTQDD